MITKRPRGSGRKRKTPPIFFLIIMPVFLVCVIYLILHFCLSRSTFKAPPPVYEEIYFTTTDLREEIRKIDYAIYESLYLNGTKGRDVFFSNVQPRHQNGYIWDFTGLSIKYPDLPSALGFQENITKDLAALGPEISLRKEKAFDGSLICHVFAKGFYTHKIVLGFGRQEPHVKDQRPRVAIIIDDLGFDSEMAASFIQLDLPLSFSVLPFAPFTESIVREANKRSCEVILHLPMEPKNYPYVDPGPGALFLSMPHHEIMRILNQNLSKVPGAVGMNNHMGSSFTESRSKMLIILKELKKRNLFYIDSRTTSETVGLQLAKKIGVPAARRSIFLDNDLDPRAIKIQVERLLSMARDSGVAIGIGHPHKETLKILREYRSKIDAECQVVPVSELVS